MWVEVAVSCRGQSFHLWVIAAVSVHSLLIFLSGRPPGWPNGKASACREADLGSIPSFAVDPFPGGAIPVTPALVLWWLPCQVPGLIESALELVGPVSVYCDWVR